MYFLKFTDITQLIARLDSANTVYVPHTHNEQYFLNYWNEKGAESESFTFNPFRTALPFLKALFFQPKCLVAEYFPVSYTVEASEKRQIIFGVKACDLLGKRVLDTIFLNGEYVDPLYDRCAKNTVIISGDCTEALQSCFCTMVGLQPYPEEGYDLNMSPVNGGYIFESGSEEGEQIVKEHLDLFTEATEEHINERDQQRIKLKEIVERQNQDYITKESRQRIIEENLNAPIWHDVSQTCVECNGCNYVCPTCYCFFLFDQKHNDGNERIKVWDSCFHAGYARMAGGITPRLHLVDRFKNHYYHKFDSFVTNYEFEACSGCGRCIEACLGQIDKREVLKSIERYVELK